MRMSEDITSKAPHGFNHIVVVGLGLIGASLAAAISKSDSDVEVFGVDVDSRTCGEAISRGWVANACAPESEAFSDFVKDRADLVVLATPVAAVDDYLRLLRDWDYRGVITDTLSTKAHILAATAEILPYRRNYVPGHPMAGSEKNGIDGARPDLFEGANWILCPDADTPPEHFQRLHELITSLNARVVAIAPDEHDDSIAVVSHVPHIIAASLVQLAHRHADEQQSLMRLAAGGFKDSTRIAAGSSKLWCGIAFDNACALTSGLREMQGIIGDFADAIDAHDREATTRLLEEAAQARRALPAAWVPSTDKLLEVRIPMSDRKGVVAEVTTIASSAGCNIQSIEIDHITEDRAVLSLVLTDEGDVGKLSAQLIGAGVDVIGHGLQGGEVGDLVQGVTGLGQQGLVDDDAEGLVAVTNGQQLAVLAVEVEVIGGELVGEVGAGEVIAELAPGLDGASVAALEHGGGLGLIHLNGEGVVVLAGGGGDDLHGDAGLLGVLLGKLLPGGIGLGLEVQVVDRASGFRAGSGAGCRGGVAVAAASQQSQAQAGRQHKSERFLHLLFLLINFGSLQETRVNS